MPDSVCCLVHENIYNSLFWVGLLCIGYLVVLFSVFFRTLSWPDWVSCLFLLVLLGILGARLVLLNAGLSKKIYEYAEEQSYAEILLSEKPDLPSTFPFIQKIEDPDENLKNMSLKKIPVRIHCNRKISQSQCEELEKFILNKISSMGGTPFAELHLDILVPSASESGGENRVIFSRNIAIDTQTTVQDINQWVKKAFPKYEWLGITALLMLAGLQILNTICFFRIARPERRRYLLIYCLFGIGMLVIFGGFFLLNHFHAEILYCRMPVFLIVPYAFSEAGCCWARYYLRKKELHRFTILPATLFPLLSFLVGLFLLVVDYR